MVLGGLGVYQLWWRRRVRNVRLARWIEQGPCVIFGTFSGPIEVRVRDGGVISRWPSTPPTTVPAASSNFSTSTGGFALVVTLVDQRNFFVPVTHRPHQRPRGPRYPERDAYPGRWEKYPDAAGALIVSPSPYGTCADLEAIAQVCQ